MMKSNRGNAAGLFCLITVWLIPFFFFHERDLTLIPGWLSLPVVYEGDEPQYLVILSSILKDGDVDVENNYHRALVEGTFDMGTRYRFSVVGHQSWLVRPGISNRVNWLSVYSTQVQDITHKNLHGRMDTFADRVFPRKSGFEDVDLSACMEIPHHPPGLPLLLSLVLFFMQPSAALDAVSLLSAILAGIAGILVVYAILSILKLTNVTRWAILVGFAAGTPAWHYSRAFFPDIYLAALAAGVILWTMKGKNRLLSSLAVGLGGFIKSTFYILIIPLLIHALLKRRKDHLVELLVPWGIMVLFQLWMNNLLFGSPFTFSVDNRILLDFSGVWGALFSPSKGLLLFSPFLLLAIPGTRTMNSSRPADTLFLITAFGAYFAVIATSVFWHGGFCYSYRQLLPAVVFLVPLAAMGMDRCRPWTRLPSLGLILLSVLINLPGVVLFHGMWDATVFKLLSCYF